MIILCQIDIGNLIISFHVTWIEDDASLCDSYCAKDKFKMWLIKYLSGAKKNSIQIVDWNSSEYFIEILSQLIAGTVNLRLQIEFRANTWTNRTREFREFTDVYNYAWRNCLIAWCRIARRCTYHREISLLKESIVWRSRWLSTKLLISAIQLSK